MAHAPSLRTSLAALALGIAVSTLAVPNALAEDPVYTGLFSNVAVGGYDPVAYFDVGEPVQGDRRFATTYQGAEFRFSSQANLDTFLTDPAHYAPQYGGYCAWAMAQGYTAKGDPAYWEIVDDRLYLNYNREIQQRWQADIPGFIAAADANYPAILDN